MTDERSLREWNVAFEDYFRLSTDLLCVIDVDGYLVQFSPAFGRLLGWSDAELLARPVLSFIHPDDLNVSRLELEGDPADDTGDQFENRVRCADGSYRWIAWTAVPPFADGRRFAIGRDITERRQAEAAIREQSNLLRSIIYGTENIVFVKDADGRYIMVNPSGARVQGLAAEAIIGRSDAEIAPELAARRRESDLRVMRDGRPEAYEAEFLVQGEARTFSIMKAPYRSASGAIIGVVGVGHDITEKRRLEAQVYHAQKMEAVGRLAGGIAHDFNNQLTAILSHAAFAQRSPTVEAARADLDEIRRAAEAAAVLTRRLLAFSRQQTLKPRALIVNDVIQRAERMLSRLAGDHVTIVTTLEPTLAIVEADPGQIEQVLVNLVVNASDAMPDGGTIWVETSNVVVTGADGARLPGCVPGSYVRLAVRDNGEGMDEETKRHAFEPFFSTKAEGQGTGLGLSSVYGIVTQSRGCVYVESNPGAGSEFAVYLPESIEPSQASAPAWTTPTSMPAQVRGGTEMVLVVEDNPAVRRTVVRILKDAGYRVLVASNGFEGMAAFAQAGTPVDLVVTDLLMPEMGGITLLARLRDDQPALKGLLVSGYDQSAPKGGGALPPGTAFLTKPFSEETLLRAVRDVLDRPVPD
jgi:two-component system, cell cycle sensor histidine kinase and response regulator CckA